MTVEKGALVFRAMLAASNRGMFRYTEHKRPWRLDVPYAHITHLSVATYKSPGFMRLFFSGATSYTFESERMVDSTGFDSPTLRLESQTYEGALTPVKTRKGSILFSVERARLEPWLKQVVSQPEVSRELSSAWLERSWRALWVGAMLAFVPILGLIGLLTVALALPRVNCLERQVTGTVGTRGRTMLIVAGAGCATWILLGTLGAILS